MSNAIFNPDAQADDLIRRLMERTNDTGLALYQDAIARIVFLNRISSDAAAQVRILAEMATGERESSDCIAHDAFEFIDALGDTWGFFA